MKRNIWIKTSGLLLAWVVSLMFTSCYRDTLYYTYQHLPQDGWTRGDTVVFSLPEAYAKGNYRVEIGLRHNVHYPYCDLWLGMSVQTDSTSTRTDTLHLQLASSEGAWQGNSSGGLFQFVEPETLPISIEGTDSLRSIQLFHLMKGMPLEGVSDLGIRLFQEN